jgi:hypothetical protein
MSLLDRCEMLVARLLSGHRKHVVRELRALSDYIVSVLERERERPPRPCSVVLLGSYFADGAAESPACIAWSGMLRDDETRTVYLMPWRAIDRGAYLVCLSGAWMSDVRVGDMLVSGAGTTSEGPSCGPLFQVHAPLQPGIHVAFSVRFPKD